MPAFTPRDPDAVRALLDEVIAEKERTLSVKEACVLIGVSDKTIKKAIRSGALPAFMPPGARRDRPGAWKYTIRPEDLGRWWVTGWDRG